MPLPNPSPSATATSLAGLPAASVGNRGQADDSVTARIQEYVIWDRKTDGGFPETKELKRRVRDLVEPGRRLGHVDRDYPEMRPGGEAAGKERGEVGDRLQASERPRYGGDDGVGDGNAKNEKCEDCS